MIKEILFFKNFKIINFIGNNYLQKLFYIGNNKNCILGIVFLNGKLNFLRVFNNTIIDK
jgi:hypothetical protein